MKEREGQGCSYLTRREAPQIFETQYFKYFHYEKRKIRTKRQIVFEEN